MDTPITWRKSSYSGSESNCVEVHSALTGVRDSKNATGPHLSVDVAALVSAIRAGRIG